MVTWFKIDTHIFALQHLGISSSEKEGPSDLLLFEIELLSHISLVVEQCQQTLVKLNEANSEKGRSRRPNRGQADKTIQVLAINILMEKNRCT